MKTYLNNLLNEQYKKLTQVKSKEEFENINQNIAQLLFYIKKIKNENDYMSVYKSICLSDDIINNKFHDFIIEIINLYSSIPLLDTESSISYPVLKNIKISSYNELFDFWNKVYQSELPNINRMILNNSNTIIFEKNCLQKFLLFPGKCILYKDSYADDSKVIIDRFYNIRDFVIPCSTAAPLLTNNKASLAVQNIISAYIRAKAVQMLKQSKYHTEAKKLELINIDLLAYDARCLKKYIDSFEKNPVIKGHILNFIYTIIGYDLAHSNNITLDELLNNYTNNNSFENDHQKITDHTKILVKKLKDSELKK